jgi:hypothetical protein
MADAYFTVRDEVPEGGRYLGTGHTAGPWDHRLQHGGPPNALMVRAAERLAAHATGRQDLLAMRVAAEFIGPVPVGEVEVTAEVVRAARTGVLVASNLSVAGRPCVQARIWLIRFLDTADVAHPPQPVQSPPAHLPGLGINFPYADSIDWRAESGSLVALGPGVIWARVRIPLVPGEDLSGLQRVTLVGDSASGISAELDWDVWSFLNVDIDVHLVRPVHGDWMRIDATTRLGGHGSALAQSTISDTSGVVATTAQTLVLAPRR